MVTDDKVPFEIELELPELLEGPVRLASGELVDVGDSVIHPSFGVGKIYRVITYHDAHGVLLCVEFPNGEEKMLGLKLVKKVNQ